MAKRQQKIRIFSALEVANLCGVVNQTAINWIRNSYLKAFITPGGQYRVYQEDLLDFLNERGMRIPPELESISKQDLDWSTVAIIDDDHDINSIIKTIIEKAGFKLNIIQAYDGFSAGALITEKRPGFIILDIDLPGIDGNKICRKLKIDSTFGKPFVITITGLDNTDMGDRAIKSGADAFLQKPLDFDKLTEILGDFVDAVQIGET
ncbi:response regulator [Spirochaetota bacterium]